MIQASQRQLSQLSFDQLPRCCHLNGRRGLFCRDRADTPTSFDHLFDGRVVWVNISIALFKLVLGLVQTQSAMPVRFYLAAPGFIVDAWCESALFEVFINFFLFFFDHFLYLLFVPQVDSIEEVGTAVYEVAFILTKHGLEGAFDIDSVLVIVVFLYELFLGADALVVEVLPDGFGGCSGVHDVFGGRSLECGCSGIIACFVGGVVAVLLLCVGLAVGGGGRAGVELGGYFAIGFEVFLLIKVH